MARIFANKLLAASLAWGLLLAGCGRERPASRGAWNDEVLPGGAQGGAEPGLIHDDVPALDLEPLSPRPALTAIAPQAPPALPAPIVIQLVIPQSSAQPNGVVMSPVPSEPSSASDGSASAAPASSVLLVVPSPAGGRPAVLTLPSIRVQTDGTLASEGQTPSTEVETRAPASGGGNTGPNGFQNNGVDARSLGTPTVYGNR